ncbi:MAG: TfoX/Sxy family protein [Flavobacteriia bacterium]|nr:TfoX/Sxy family protein [Flavobacteriia bacterium]
MAYNEILADRIAEQLLSSEIHFTEKKMFGGIAFMINDKMCVGVVKEELMLRVLDEKYDELIEHQYANPMKFTGKTMKGFIFVASEGVENNIDLKRWIDFGIEFGKFGIVKSKKKK